MDGSPPALTTHVLSAGSAPIGASLPVSSASTPNTGLGRAG